MNNYETCIICDCETGNAGQYDGSLYDIDLNGPYCQECFDKLPEEIKEENDKI